MERHLQHASEHLDISLFTETAQRLEYMSHISLAYVVLLFGFSRLLPDLVGDGHDGIIIRLSTPRIRHREGNEASSRSDVEDALKKLAILSSKSGEMKVMVKSLQHLKETIEERQKDGDENVVRKDDGMVRSLARMVSAASKGLETAMEDVREKAIVERLLKLHKKGQISQKTIGQEASFLARAANTACIKSMRKLKVRQNFLGNLVYVLVYALVR